MRELLARLAELPTISVRSERYVKLDDVLALVRASAPQAIVSVGSAVETKPASKARSPRGIPSGPVDHQPHDTVSGPSEELHRPSTSPGAAEGTSHE